MRSGWSHRRAALASLPAVLSRCARSAVRISPASGCRCESLSTPWPATLPLTDAARARFAAFDPDRDEPAGFCMPLGTPRNTLSGTSPLEVLQTADRVYFVFQPNLLNAETRRVYLDGRPLPAADPDRTPTWLGTSRGHWEGDALVVETIEMEPQAILNGAGLSHGGGLKVRERWHLARTRSAARLLVNDIVLDDPESFTHAAAPEARLRLGAGCAACRRPVLRAAVDRPALAPSPARARCGARARPECEADALSRPGAAMTRAPRIAGLLLASRTVALQAAEHPAVAREMAGVWLPDSRRSDRSAAWPLNAEAQQAARALPAEVRTRRSHRSTTPTPPASPSRCPSSMRLIAQYPFEILFTPDRVTVFFEIFGSLRRIRLDADPAARSMSCPRRWAHRAGTGKATRWWSRPRTSAGKGAAAQRRSAGQQRAAHRRALFDGQGSKPAASSCATR